MDDGEVALLLLFPIKNTFVYTPRFTYPLDVVLDFWLDHDGPEILGCCLSLFTYLLSCLLNRCTHRGPLLDIMHFDVFWKRALGILAHGYGNDPAVKKERVRRDGKGGRKRNFSESWQSKLIHHIFKNGDTHKSPSPFL